MKEKVVLKTVGKNLKAIRLIRGLTQEELAKKSGVATNHYAKIERGEVSPRIHTLANLIKALKAKSSDILPF